jgi:hypothetical protein
VLEQRKPYMVLDGLARELWMMLELVFYHGTVFSYQRSAQYLAYVRLEGLLEARLGVFESEDR